MEFKKTAILGVGLIGGSIALALRKRGLCSDVSGFGRNPERLAEAQALGIIDSFDTDPAKAVEGADLVVLATPAGKFEELAGKIKGSLGTGAIVIDAGSVKGGLVVRLQSVLPRFVGCHPIAGGERSGFEAADAGLFEGALCVITRTDATDEGSFKKISALWKSMGCTIKTMSPGEHDRLYGLLSHLPHIVAYALVNTAGGEGGGEGGGASLGLAGRGFRDMTRIAASSPGLWRDICSMNAEQLLPQLEAFMEQMKSVSQMLRDGDLDGLEEFFSKARALRKGIE